MFSGMESPTCHPNTRAEMISLILLAQSAFDFRQYHQRWHRGNFGHDDFLVGLGAIGSRGSLGRFGDGSLSRLLRRLLDDTEWGCLGGRDVAAVLPSLPLHPQS